MEIGRRMRSSLNCYGRANARKASSLRQRFSIDYQERKSTRAWGKTDALQTHKQCNLKCGYWSSCPNKVWLLLCAPTNSLSPSRNSICRRITMHNPILNASAVCCALLGPPERVWLLWGSCCWLARMITQNIPYFRVMRSYIGWHPECNGLSLLSLTKPPPPQFEEDCCKV